MASSDSGSVTPPRQKKGSTSPNGRREDNRSSRSPKRERSADRGRSRPNFNDDIPPNPKLFVTNIDSKYSREETQRDLKELFGSFGEIRDITVKTKPGSANSYVFVEYSSVEWAKKAQQELQGKEFKGKELKVEFGRGERRNEDRRAGVCYICHREGHFAKDCRYNRDRRSPEYDRRDRGDRRDERGYRRDQRDRSRRKRRSYSDDSSSDSRDRRARRDRDRDSHRRRDRYSPDRKNDYYSRRH